MAVSVTTAPSKGRDADVAARASRVLRVTFDSAYVAGGEPFDPKTYIGFTPAVVILSPRYAAGATGSGGRVFQYDHTNKKILVFQDQTPAANAQLAEAGVIDLSGVVLDVVCFSD